MTGSLIEFDSVTFSYRGREPVLDGASLSLKGGERLLLEGGNGSGKSTLLQIIVGLLRPAAGTVSAFGKALADEADFREARRKIGLVFQNSDDQLFCPTVLEDVAFGPLNLGYSQKEARAVALETLDRVGLTGFEERVTYKLSGGEKRLAALATVLAMSPEVLLLDEPAAGLDEKARVRIAGILAGLPQSMIIVSHDNDFAGDLPTRRATLRDGRVSS